MVYNDVVKPAINGTNNAKHGSGVVLTPGINVDQIIDGGKLSPVGISEPKLTDRFDDNHYYGNTLTGNLYFYSNAEWIVPNGVTQITVKAFGQGGYGQTASGNSGHGGGAGAYAQSSFSVVAGTTYSITVNGGAVGGDGVNTKLKRGATTIFLAAAGKSGANGGIGGSITDCIGDTLLDGGDGADPSGFGGGGGGASSDIEHGAFASDVNGAVGTGNGGSGGNGGAQIGGAQGPGDPGSNPGGGGGGGSYDLFNTINYAGGAGGLGRLVIVW